MSRSTLTGFMLVLIVISYLGMRAVAPKEPLPGILTLPEPSVTSTPAIIPARVGNAGPPTPTALPFSVWRETEPVTIATAGEAQAALIAAGFPWYEAELLADASHDCEAPVMDSRAGVSIGIDLDARGDGGLAHGPFAIRVDVHPQLAARYNLDNLHEAARAAMEIRTEAVSYGKRPLSPWSCVQ